MSFPMPKALQVYLEKVQVENSFKTFMTNYKNDHWDLYNFPMQNAPKAFAHLSDEPFAPDMIFLGFEWEHQDANWTARLKLAHSSGLLDYLNYRGGGAPVEIVSIPATLKWHKDFLLKEFFPKGLCETFTACSSCGMHIHINKSAFTPETLKKFITFTVNPENHEWMTKLAGRDQRSNGNCAPNFMNLQHVTIEGKKYLTNSSLTVDNQLIASDGTGKNRAVNTGTPYGTVEYRIFTTPINKVMMLKNLEFTDALIRFVRVVDYPELTIPAFIKFVLKNKDLYDNLCQFMDIKEPVVEPVVKVEGASVEEAAVAKPKRKKPDTDIE